MISQKISQVLHPFSYDICVGWTVIWIHPLTKRSSGYRWPADPYTRACLPLREITHSLSLVNYLVQANKPRGNYSNLFKCIRTLTVQGLRESLRDTKHERDYFFKDSTAG